MFPALVVLGPCPVQEAFSIDKNIFVIPWNTIG